MGKAFRFIVGAEIAVLLVLLGVWGYRQSTKNHAVASENGSLRTTPRAISSLKTPNGKPKRESIRPSGVLGRSPDVQTAQVSKSPVTFPSTNTENHARKNARKIETPRYIRRNDPLPALQSPVILIEKSKKRLTVFDGERAVKQYPASTGQNLGDKVREGDYRTPEGEFYVCVRNATSKYTRALGLSYPNREDAQRGLRVGLISQRDFERIDYAIGKRRQPPWKTPLGGEIMIHGDRRGGRTTQGCIALEDRDILELFPRIPVGTRVVIQP